MKYKRITLTGAAILVGMAALLLLLTALANTNVPIRDFSPVSDDTTYPENDAQGLEQEPPLSFPPGPWPWYAHGGITVHPEPLEPGRLTEFCAAVFNSDSRRPYTATLEFGIAPLSIGLPFTPTGHIDIEVPAGGDAHGCVQWMPPSLGPWNIEVLLHQTSTPEILRIQRNLDLTEPLQPYVQHDLEFLVGNPYDHPITVTFGMNAHVSDWIFGIGPDTIYHLTPGETAEVQLNVKPMTDLPPDGHPIIDIEAYDRDRLIGGFRKIFRVPVPLHRTADPFFAEPEIAVWPYPPRAGEPTEICVDLYNWTALPQLVEAHFSWSGFGIGLPFQPIGEPRMAEIPPTGRDHVCIVWIPPVSGDVGVQVELHHLGEVTYPPQLSQRILDITEPLQPGVSHSITFPVGNFSNPLTNPDPQPMAVWLEVDTLQPGWEVTVSPTESPTINPGEKSWFTMTVTPPLAPLPPDNTPIVDVRAMTNRLDEDVLLGGFRKIYRPPVPLHRFPDPPFAESELSIHPYPPIAGEPTELCVELRNPTSVPQEVLVHFAWANFGIGLPFTPINGPRYVVLPPHSLVKECIHWVPPITGQICLEVTLEIPTEQGDIYPPQRSQRNIDVIETLLPGVPDQLQFQVGNPLESAATVEFDIISHQPFWEFQLDPPVLEAMAPGETRSVQLTVYPLEHLPPADSPIVDIAAFANGHPIGGFRKIMKPPVPLHPFPDPPFAEREISIHPYPPLAGEPTEVCVELRNPTDEPQDVLVNFAWANFGIGLPFTPIGGPRPVHLPPHRVVNECIYWIPPISGQVCLEVTLEMAGELSEVYPPQRSQRNIDVIEPLMPGVEDRLVFPVGNPTEKPVTITLGLVPLLPEWEINLEPKSLANVSPGESHTVTLYVVPPPDLPPDGQPILDVEAYIGETLLGGFRKVFRPPIPLHPFPDPPFAEREISIHPYPPRAGEPTEVCVDLRNPTPLPHDVEVQFAWAAFGIGLPFTPIDGSRPVHLPPHSVIRECIHWIPPFDGQVCIQTTLEMDGYAPQRSQLNIDINEPLQPGISHTLPFPVGNPYQEPMTVTLGLVPHLPGWEVDLSHDILPAIKPAEFKVVSLTVRPPEDLPADRTPIVDVEAYINGGLIGGFRKIYRPPVPIHRPRDPMYAESEIWIHPYPPRQQEPTEVGVEIRNPTDADQAVIVKFKASEFGIGLPFNLIHDPLEVVVPAEGIVRPAIVWVPPHGGLWCIEVELVFPGGDRRFISRRNIDVGEPLEPLVPHQRPFKVGNPYTRPVTITLGLVPHFPDWGLELSQDVLRDVKPAEFREVTLTVTPPADLPADGDPIVDIEAFVEGRLLGGFRKIFRPPVPIHRPRDPIYAESEIGIDPYPVIPGQPVKLSVEVFNPTDKDRLVTATFSVAHFGIGLPFSTSHIMPNPIVIFVPANGAARGHVVWQPPDWGGKFCVKVELVMEGHEPIWSQRNIDVGEPLEPGQPHAMVFQIGNPTAQTATVELGLINHRDGWQASLSHDFVANLRPGETRPVTLTVEPPEDAEIGFGDPVVDVEAFINGVLIGGFRKIDRPPIPLHKPHEKGYAESEIVIEPYPPKLGQISEVSTIIQNTSDSAMTVNLEFGWAKFGMGIPFTNTGMSPYTRSVTLGPALTETVSIDWQPQLAGHQCVLIQLSDPAGTYEPQRSQRNVDVIERPPCGVVQVYSFTVYNDSPFSATVDIGLITFNVPAEWQVSTIPSDTLELGPFAEGTVTVFVEITCPPTFADLLFGNLVQDIQQASGSLPLIDVEGYIKGELVGGIELQFLPQVAPEKYYLYLPFVMK